MEVDVTSEPTAEESADEEVVLESSSGFVHVLEGRAWQSCKLGTHRPEPLFSYLYRCAHSSEFFSFHGTFRPSMGGAHRPLFHQGSHADQGGATPPRFAQI